MTLGQKIKKLRNEKGLTQKDLADQVHVTFQTVSKWEKDENEPDVTTLRELSKLFDCSLDYLLSTDEEPADKEEIVEEPPEQVVKTVVIHEHPLHVCRKCEKPIPEDELAVEHLTRTEGYGRHSRKVSAGEAYYHKDCLIKVKQEREAAALALKKMHAKRAKKYSFGWGIFGGVVALVIALLCLLMIPACQAAIHPAVAVLLSILAGYAIFAMLYCIIGGSFIADVFLWCSSLSIKMPGVIFTWDIDGIVWAIAMKIFLAILAFSIGVAALMFAIVFSASLAIFAFPFVLIHNINTNYSDSFVD